MDRPRHPVTRVMDFIGFNNFFIILLFNYMIKINAHKIEYQPKNRHLFETIIPRKQTKSIMQLIYQPI